MKFTEEETARCHQANREHELRGRVEELEQELARLRAVVGGCEDKEDGDVPDGYWWCPSCKRELCSECVTHEEMCDTCGHAVTWVALIKGEAFKGWVERNTADV